MGASWWPPGASWWALGASWRSIVDLLGPLGALFGASWTHLAASSSHSLSFVKPLVAIFGLQGASGASWGMLLALPRRFWELPDAPKRPQGFPRRHPAHPEALWQFCEALPCAPRRPKRSPTADGGCVAACNRFSGGNAEGLRESKDAPAVRRSRRWRLRRRMQSLQRMQTQRRNPKLTFYVVAIRNGMRQRCKVTRTQRSAAPAAAQWRNSMPKAEAAGSSRRRALPLAQRAPRAYSSGCAVPRPPRHARDSCLACATSYDSPP